VHHLAAALSGLPPGEAPGDLPYQVRQQRGPGLISYRGSSDCRVLVVSCKPIMIAPAAPLRGPVTCASNLTVTNYSCRNCDVTGSGLQLQGVTSFRSPEIR